MRVIKPGWVEHEEGAGKLGIYSIDVHPEGACFATGGSDARVRLWAIRPVLPPPEVASVEPLTQGLGVSARLDGAPLPQVVSVAAAAAAQARATNASVANVAAAGASTGATPASSDGSEAPSSSSSSSSNSDFSVTNASTAGPLRLATLSGHQGGVNIVRFSPHGRWLASGSDDTCVYLWKRSNPASAIGSAGSGGAGLGAAAEAEGGARAAFSGMGAGSGGGGGGGGSGGFGSSGNGLSFPTVDPWARAHVLRGHSMDVHDLAWAPDNSLLASCSVDNSILIWRVPILTSSGASYLAGAPHSSSSYAPSSPSGFGAGAGAGAGQPPPLLLSPERRLSRHSSWVKGLAWDPMGTYLASAAEDKTVILWRTSDWQPEHSVTEPFQKTSTQTLFLRPAWSADGGVLCAVNATKSRKPVAAMLRRTPSGDGLSPAWSSSAELAGHNAPVATSRFSSQIYNATGLTSPSSSASATTNAAAASSSSSVSAPSASTKHLSAVALGSADGVVTVWRTDKPRPVVVLRDCFHDAITDLAWTPDGYGLLLASREGGVVALRFDPEELGHALGLQARKAACRKLYGAELGSMVGGGLRGGHNGSNGYYNSNDSLPGAHGVGLMRAHGVGRAVVEDVRQMDFEEGYDHDNENDERQADSQPTSAASTTKPAANTAAAQPAGTSNVGMPATATGGTGVASVAAAAAPPRLQVVSRRADGKKRITLGGGAGAAPTANSSSAFLSSTGNVAGVGGAAGSGGDGATMTPFQAASHAELQGANNTTTAEGLSADLLTRRSQQPLMSSSSSSSSSSKKQRLLHRTTSDYRGSRGADAAGVVRSWVPPPPLVPLPLPSRPVACQIAASSSSLSSSNNMTPSSWLECLPGAVRPHRAVGTTADRTMGTSGATTTAVAAAASAVEATFQLVCSMVVGNGSSSSGMGAAAPKGGNASKATQWRTLVHGKPTTVCGNSHLAVCGTAEGSVHVFDANTGVRLLPALFAPGSGGVARLTLEQLSGAGNSSSSGNSCGSSRSSSSLLLGGLLGVVSADGEVCVWDLSSLVKVGQASLSPLLASSRALIATLGASNSTDASASTAGASGAALGTGDIDGGGRTGSAATTTSTASMHSADSSGQCLSRLEALIVGRGPDNRPRVAVTILSVPVAAAAGGATAQMNHSPGSHDGSNGTTNINNRNEGAATTTTANGQTSAPSSSSSSRLEAFGLHCGLGAWVRLADARFAASDFFTVAPPTTAAAAGAPSPLPQPHHYASPELQANALSNTLSINDLWSARHLNEQPLAQLHWAVTTPTPTQPVLGSMPQRQAGMSQPGGLTAATLLALEPPASSSSNSTSGFGASSATAATTAGSIAQVTALARAGPWQRLATQAHLEDRIACAAALGAASEFQHWLGLYARWLAAAADVPRLRLLCDRLLGPTAPSAAAATPKERATKGSGSASSSGQIEELAAAATPLRPHPPLPWWSAEAGPTCCGGLLSKRGLLASTVFPAIASNRDLQRLLGEYSDALDALKQVELGSTEMQEGL